MYCYIQVLLHIAYVKIKCMPTSAKRWKEGIGQDLVPLQMLDWGLWFLTGGVQEGPPQFLATGQLTMSGVFLPSVRQLESKEGSPTWRTRRFNLMSKVSAFHFCPILFIRTSHWIQTKLKGRSLHKGLDTRMQRPVEVILVAACHNAFTERIKIGKNVCKAPCIS